ncbi:MAG: UDP-N-acetylmuramoyl-tripeptide--D-alanyl-D-alanine ligase, partial [Candidatus Omnitrophica bacterium]|nr:UDP-N-acetylmuramoyl-tripeptide--D-alanyl-D-alanine ligase [Candidatus Omnitrophota bacterium]
FAACAAQKGARCIVKEKNKKIDLKRLKNVTVLGVNDTVKALGCAARHHRQKFSIPVIAVNGSNGKTTTKEMLSWVLSARYRVLKNEGTQNNHIGVPLTLLKLSSEHDAAVVELGTNHFGEIKYLSEICLPTMGIITNIGASHLEFFKDLKGVRREKFELIKNIRHPGIVILNADDPLMAPDVFANRSTPAVFGVGINHPSDFTASEVTSLKLQTSFRINNHTMVLRNPGAHNVYNALCAGAAARIVGFSYKEIAGRLKSFEFPKGRLQVLMREDVFFIDDTYNANPFSFHSALTTLKNFKTTGRKILVMGDMMELGKGGELFHSRAGESAAGFCDAIITVGRLSQYAAEAAKKMNGMISRVFACLTLQEAREALYNKVSIRKNDVILIKGSRAMKMEDMVRD